MEIAAIWKDLLLSRLRALLEVETLASFVDIYSISSQNILHNASFISKNGLVANIDDKDKIPDWVISAMNYLLHPNDKTCLTYPTFHNDVYLTILDYFIHSESQSRPIIAHDMYQVLIVLLDHVYANEDLHGYSKLDTNGNQSEDKSFYATNLKYSSTSDLSKLDNPSKEVKADCYDSAIDLDEYSLDDSTLSLRNQSKYDSLKTTKSAQSSSNINTNVYKAKLVQAVDFRTNPLKIDTNDHTTSLFQNLPFHLLANLKVLYEKSFHQSFQNDSIFLEKLKSLAEKLVHVYQIIALILPPATRFTFQILLRFLHDFSRSPNQNCDQICNDWKRILFQFKSNEANEAKTDFMLYFMIVFQEFIVNISPELKNHLEMAITYQHVLNIDEKSMTMTKVSSTLERDLDDFAQLPPDYILDTILNNATMSSKERKKCLKQFQAQFPSVYHQRFETNCNPGDKNVIKVSLSEKSGRKNDSTTSSIERIPSYRAVLASHRPKITKTLSKFFKHDS